MFFLILIICLLPLQPFLQWNVENYFLGSPSRYSIGFSGIIYGIDAFILWSSIYGKEKFHANEIGLYRNKKVRNAISFLTAIGLAWSFAPGINMLAHITGFLAGSFIFLF